MRELTDCSFFFLITLGFLSFWKNMSSLVERLRVRSDRKPIYNLDDSDDDADFLPRKPGATQEKFERIVRTDAVCYFPFALTIFV